MGRRRRLLLKLAGGNVADAFERQRAENARAQLVSVLEATSDFVAMAERQSGRLIYLNQAGRSLIGFSLDEDVSYWKIGDIVPPWVQDMKIHVCYPTVEAFGSWTGESAVVTRDGREITVSESITLLPSRTDEGAECFSYIIRDISDQKRLEKEVLDIAEREQSRFGHDLHDGLGQHLTGVQFMAQVLQQKLETRMAPETAEAAEIALLIRQAISQTRDLARSLSPVVLQSKSLQDALRDLAAGITRRGQAQCTTELDDDHFADQSRDRNPTLSDCPGGGEQCPQTRAGRYDHDLARTRQGRAHRPLGLRRRVRLPRQLPTRSGDGSARDELPIAGSSAARSKSSSAAAAPSSPAPSRKHRSCGNLPPPVRRRSFVAADENHLRRATPPIQSPSPATDSP